MKSASITHVVTPAPGFGMGSRLVVYKLEGPKRIHELLNDGVYTLKFVLCPDAGPGYTTSYHDDCPAEVWLNHRGYELDLFQPTHERWAPPLE